MANLLPFEPLNERVLQLGGVNSAFTVLDPDSTEYRRLRRAWFRGRQRGHLSFTAADDLCVVLLGAHPAAVWGDDWFVDDGPADVTPQPPRSRPAASNAEKPPASAVCTRPDASVRKRPGVRMKPTSDQGRVSAEVPAVQLELFPSASR